jgi:hypothetical protein
MRNGQRFRRRPFHLRHTTATEVCAKKAYFFVALFLAVLRPVLRADAFLAPPRLAARFFGAARFFVARFVDFFAARFFVDFFAARLFVDFFAARFLVVFLAARFFGAAALRFRDFFFGASGEAVGVIIDIMSAIIVASPVWVH